MSNFNFLTNYKSKWIQGFDAIYSILLECEKKAITNPRETCLTARIALENIVKLMYKYDRKLQMPYDNNLSAMLNEKTFKSRLSPKLVQAVYLIKDNGNTAAHSVARMQPVTSLLIVKNLQQFFYWFTRTYMVKVVRTILLFLSVWL